MPVQPLCWDVAQSLVMKKAQAAASAGGAGRRPRVRDAEGRPKGGSCLATRGRTER